MGRESKVKANGRPEKDYAYGAEAFEAYMEKSNREIKPNMKEVAVQKNDKAR